MPVKSLLLFPLPVNRVAPLQCSRSVQVFGALLRLANVIIFDLAILD